MNEKVGPYDHFYQPSNQQHGYTCQTSNQQHGFNYLTANQQLVGTESPFKERYFTKRTQDGEPPPPPREEKKRFFTYLMETTTFAGISKVYFTPRWYLKLMWMLFFTVTFCYMSIMMMELFRHYFKYPVKTDTTLGYSALPLPAVTVCNENPIKRSRLKDTPCQLQQRLNMSMSERSKFCRLVGDTEEYFDLQRDHVSCPEDDIECQEFVNMAENAVLETMFENRRRIRDDILEMDLQDIYNLGHQKNDFILSCSIRGKSCSPNSFKSSLSSEYGNCFTWLPQNGTDKVSGSGPEKGLELVLNLEIEEYIEEYNQGYGIQVIIHENGTIALPNVEGMSISSGEETSIGLKLVNITRMGGWYGDCTDGVEFRRKYQMSYTEETCRLLCLSNATQVNCGCYPAAAIELDDYLKTRHKFCRRHKWVCEDWMENHFTRHLAMVQECGCFNPCKRKTFEKRVTSRMWPSNHLLKKLEKQVCSKNKNSPKCKYTNDSNTTERRSSFAKIFIFYETLNYQNVEEKPFYDKISFMSDIGGTMGLMIGVSLLSIAEFIEVLVEYFIMMCRKLGR